MRFDPVFLLSAGVGAGVVGAGGAAGFGSGRRFLDLCGESGKLFFGILGPTVLAGRFFGVAGLDQRFGGFSTVITLIFKNRHP